MSSKRERRLALLVAGAALLLALLGCSDAASALFNDVVGHWSQVFYAMVYGEYSTVGFVTHPDVYATMGIPQPWGTPEMDDDRLATVGAEMADQYDDACFGEIASEWGFDNPMGRPTPGPGTPTVTPFMRTGSVFNDTSHAGESFPDTTWLGLQFYDIDTSKWYTGCCVPLRAYYADGESEDLLAPTPALGACTGPDAVCDGVNHVTPICISGITPTPTPTPTPSGPGPGPGPGGGAGPFSGMPSASGYITAYFDDWCYENCWFGVDHNGLDLGMTIGVAIYATSDGIVGAADDSCIMGDSDCNYNMGNYIKLLAAGDAGTWTAIYMHLDEVYVSPGDTVSRGDVIGTADNTGMSTGSHLHYEIRDPSWTPVDPYCTIWSCPYEPAWPAVEECSYCP
jgi:hypothetical protein